MLKQKLKHAIDLLYIMSQTPNGKYLRLKDASNRLHLSLSTMEPVANCLRSSNLIWAKRGPTGGYEITDKGREATLFQISTYLGMQTKDYSETFLNLRWQDTLTHLRNL